MYELVITFYLTPNLWGDKKNPTTKKTYHHSHQDNYKFQKCHRQEVLSIFTDSDHFLLIQNQLLLLGLHSVFQTDCIQYLKMTQAPFKPKTFCMVRAKSTVSSLSNCKTEKLASSLRTGRNKTKSDKFALQNSAWEWRVKATLKKTNSRKAWAVTGT